MRNLTLTFLLGALLAGAAVLPATAESRDPNEAAGYAEAVRSASEAQRGELPSRPIIEGRNIAVPAPSTAGVEPYVARTIEQNARSSR